MFKALRTKSNFFFLTFLSQLIWHASENFSTSIKSSKKSNTLCIMPFLNFSIDKTTELINIVSLRYWQEHLFIPIYIFSVGIFSINEICSDHFIPIKNFRKILIQVKKNWNIFYKGVLKSMIFLVSINFNINISIKLKKVYMIYFTNATPKKGTN